MKRVFPQAKSNTDLMEAVAYIFTNGKCEISPRAMELVKSYKSGIDIHLLSERVDHLSEKVTFLKCAVRDRDLDERTSNNSNDRLTVQQSNLDMLHRFSDNYN